MVRWTLALLMLTTGLAVAPAQAAGDQARPPQPSAQPTVRPLDLNTATAADLEKLPGIGPRLAERIVQYRQKTGGFKKVEELMNVQGIGEKNFLKLKPLITVTPPKSSGRGSEK